jgi:hypothetical protein
VEAGVLIQPQGRHIALVDFKENGAGTKADKAAQVKVQQSAREPVAALSLGDGDGKDFRLIPHKP